MANDVDACMTIFKKFYLCGWAVEQHGVLRVNVLDVVQLAKVVVDSFPVAVESHCLVANKCHVFHVERCDTVAHHAKVFAQRCCVVVHADPNKSSKSVYLYLLHRALVAVDSTTEAVVVGNNNKFSIETIRPSVVRAYKFCNTTTIFGSYFCTTMLACIVKGSNFSFLSTRDDDGLTAKVENGKVTNVRNVSF